MTSSGIRNDLERLRTTSSQTSDASPFRTAVRNIIAACRNSPVALATYCREGTVPALATSLTQVSANSQLATCVLEVALTLSQQLLQPEEGKSDSSASYAVGESVMARRMDGDFGEGTVLDTLDDGSYLVMWNEEEVAAKLAASELMPFGSGMGLSTERRQRVAPAFILNNFLMKTAIPSNDLSRVQMVVRDGADVNCTDSDGNSPLNIGVSNGVSTALIQFLISRGAHINYVGAAGSALQAAAVQDSVEAVRCLLAHGADPGLVDLDAVGEECAEILRATLLESETSPTASKKALAPEELEQYAAECFVHLFPALLATLANTQSPKLHKRVLMKSDIAAASEKAVALLDKIPVTASESSVLDALRRLPSEGSRSFGKAVTKLAELLLGEQAPSAHELQQSGTLSWLLAELSASRPAELRQRWSEFEKAFGSRVGAIGSEALEQLLALLHNTLAACETLPVYTYASAGEGAHSLKALGEPLQIGLHPVSSISGAAGAPSSAPPASEGGEGGEETPPSLSLSIDPLVRIGQLQQHLLRTCTVHDSAYEAYCTRILGCVVEERPLPNDGAGAVASWRHESTPFRRATIVGFRIATPLKLLLHTLIHEDGREMDVVMATREYRIIGRVSQDALERTRRDSMGSAVDEVADPEARIHAVTISCPEGLPVDLFLENVLSIVRRALRQAEPGVAPMTRAPSDEYGWRDRGWERGGAQFERGVAEKLRENGVANVACRQTKQEAETLMARLAGTMMVGIEVEKSTPPQPEEGGGYKLLARVQGLVAADAPGRSPPLSEPRNSGPRNSGPRSSGDADGGTSDGAHWASATVVDRSVAGVSLVYDDGAFEAAVPGYRVRAVPQPESKQRLNPLAAIFMSFEQFLSSREERRAELELLSRDAQPANLRRSLSAFHVGRAQQVGRIPPAALEGGRRSSRASGDSSPTPMDETSSEALASMEPFDIAPMPLHVRFALSTAEAPPTSADCWLTFDDSTTLLHCLQTLRESTPSGRTAALEPEELGYHPGVTCDRTGQSPIVGNRYKLRDENYDVCEPEFLRMPDSEQQQYTKIPPPVFRKPKGCGPSKWHLYFALEVAEQRKSPPDSSASAPASLSPSTRAVRAAADSGSPRAPSSTRASGVSAPSVLGSPVLLASPGRSSPLAPGGQLMWSANEVEADLLSGRLEPETVLRELRRTAAGSELRLSDIATRVLAGSYGATIAPLCSAQLMAVYREVSAAPRAPVALTAPIPSPASIAELRSEFKRAGVGEGEFADALLLLCVLSQRILVDGADEQSDSRQPASNTIATGSTPRGSGAVERPDAVTRRHLTSSVLSAKLQRQLSDALAVSSGALPLWTSLLLKRCPALFSASARTMYFRSSAFGVSRAVHWSQEAQVASVRSVYAEELAALERARLEAELGNDAQGLAEVVEQQTEIEDRVGRERLGALKSDIARVERDRLLSMAERLMELHAPSRNALEIQFEGESGFGSGVTQNFYSASANELLKVAVHEALPIWVCETAGAHADGVISHSGELVPLPLPPTASAEHRHAVCERFRFLGRLMAKACRDSFIVPLPLSPHFLHLVRGGTLTYSAFPPPGATGGVASGYAAVCARLAAIDSEGSSIGEAERRRRYERESDREFANSCLGLGSLLSLREWLRAGGCAFVCPLTDAPLCEGGEEREVTVHNLQEFTHLLAQLWLADGILAQAEAFRAGMEEVFSASTLAPFTLAELQTVLCGTMSIEWTEAELQRHLHPSGGYTKHSKVYQLLIDELQEMDNESRAKFLNFVTACPHLPPVGLSMLEIEVLPQLSGGSFPTAQTCGNKLYLPEYDTASELRDGLAEAFANTEQGGLHEHA